MITLLIKGTATEARQAAADHEVPLTVVCERLVDGRWQTVGVTPLAFHVPVTRWFNEDTTAPFPPGALLHFSSPADVDGTTHARQRAV